MELDDKLVEFLMGIEQRLGKAEGWAASEIPAYVSELLTYHTAVAVLWAVVYGFGAALFIYALVRLALYECSISESESPRKVSSIDDELGEPMTEREGAGILGVLGAFVVLACVYQMSIHIATVAKIQLAPRVYVVDYIRSELGKELGEENDRSDSNW